MRLDDVVQRPLADDGVRPHPERGVVVGQPLVDEVLQVRRGTGHALQPGGRTGKGAVRSLGNCIVAVLLLLQDVHQAQAVLRQQDTVGVDGQDVVGLRDVQRRFRLVRGDQRRAGDRGHFPVVATH